MPFNSSSDSSSPPCDYCKQAACEIWCLREIDRRLVSAGWHPISDWWWFLIIKLGLSFVLTVVVRAGRRAGKSSTLCRIACSEVLNPKHLLAPGDTTFFAMISATLPQAKERIQTCHKILTVLDVPHKPTTEQITLIDRPAGIKAFAATLKSVVSFTALGVLCDEMARWEDPDTGANPARALIGSLRPTIATMPHAIFWEVSAPWSTLDLHYEHFEMGDNEDQLTFYAPSWEANPSITEAYTHKLEPDFATWNREYNAKPMASDETKFFPAEFIERCSKTVRPLEGIDRTVAGADFAFRRNSSALAVVSSGNERFRLECNEERVPGERPLVPSKTITELVGIAHRWGSDSVAADLHYIETVRETTEDLEIGLLEFPTTTAGIEKAYVRLRVLITDERLDLTKATPELLQQLKETTSKPEHSGLSIKNKSVGNKHGDNVSALVCALWAFDMPPPDNRFATGERRYGREQGPDRMDWTKWDD